MMNHESKFPLAFIPEMDSQVLELPYVGKDLSMLIILPNEIQDETTGLQKVRQQEIILLKIKVPKGGLLRRYKNHFHFSERFHGC